MRTALVLMLLLTAPASLFADDKPSQISMIAFAWGGTSKELTPIPTAKPVETRSIQAGDDSGSCSTGSCSAPSQSNYNRRARSGKRSS
jgi:hypothetical protein